MLLYNMSVNLRLIQRKSGERLTASEREGGSGRRSDVVLAFGRAGRTRTATRTAQKNARASRIGDIVARVPVVASGGYRSGHDARRRSAIAASWSSVRSPVRVISGGFGQASSVITAPAISRGVSCLGST